MRGLLSPIFKNPSVDDQRLKQIIWRKTPPWIYSNKRKLKNTGKGVEERRQARREAMSRGDYQVERPSYQAARMPGGIGKKQGEKEEERSRSSTKTGGGGAGARTAAGDTRGQIQEPKTTI